MAAWRGGQFGREWIRVYVGLSLLFTWKLRGRESACQHRRHGPLEKEMATHPSTLAWKMPWTEEPLSMGYSSWACKRVRHDLVTKQQLAISQYKMKSLKKKSIWEISFYFTFIEFLLEMDFGSCLFFFFYLFEIIMCSFIDLATEQ